MILDRMLYLNIQMHIRAYYTFIIHTDNIQALNQLVKIIDIL